MSRLVDIALLLPNLEGGGAEKVAVHLVNGLVKRKFTVDLLVAKAQGVFLATLDPRVRVVDLDSARLRGVIAPLVRYLRRSRPQSLLVFMWPLTTIAVLARKIAIVRSRLILVEHTTISVAAERGLSPFLRWFSRLAIHLTYQHSDQIVAVSHGAAQDLARFGRLPLTSIQVIYNPVVGADSTSLVTLRAPTALTWWEGKHYRLLAVGRFKPAKDYPTLLRAFAILRHSLDVRLLILGEGELRPTMFLLIKALGIADYVEMPGFALDPAPYYRRSDLVVLSSSWEGLPSVLIESLAEGTPVVSTDCPSGPREILQDGEYGGLVPTGDPIRLARAISETLKSPRDPEKLKARAANFFVESAIDRYLEILQVPVEKSRPPTTAFEE